MKHYLITLFIMLLLSGTLVSCATSEERAAQQAETALAVEKALADRHYRIIIQRMNPRRSSMVSLSYGYSFWSVICLTTDGLSMCPTAEGKD